MHHREDAAREPCVTPLGARSAAGEKLLSGIARLRPIRTNNRLHTQNGQFYISVALPSREKVKYGAEPQNKGEQISVANAAITENEGGFLSHTHNKKVRNGN
ncbi:hypothetical protein MRX96_032545 [Rhipicephalus microplus]